MSTAAPPHAFKTRPPAGFIPGMKLEVVDSRVATISAVKDRLVPQRPILRIPVKPKTIATSTPNEVPKEKLPRGRPPKHKRIEKMVRSEHASDDDSMSSSGGKRWRGSSEDNHPTRTVSTRDRHSPAPLGQPPHPSPPLNQPPPRHQSLHPSLHPPRALIARHIADLELTSDPGTWTQRDVAALLSRVAGAAAGAAAAAARLSGAELVMASCEELVQCLRLRLGPAVKVYAIVRHLRDSLS